MAQMEGKIEPMLPRKPNSRTTDAPLSIRHVMNQPFGRLLQYRQRDFPTIEPFTVIQLQSLVLGVPAAALAFSVWFTARDITLHQTGGSAGLPPRSC
jgi:hypothetical protein